MLFTQFLLMSTLVNKLITLFLNPKEKKNLVLDSITYAQIMEWNPFIYLFLIIYIIFVLTFQNCDSCNTIFFILFLIKTSRSKIYDEKIIVLYILL